MSLSDRPTLREIIERTDAEIAGRMGLGALLRRGVLAAISRVLAGLSHGWHGLIEWVARQQFPDTAEADELDRHATLWGVPRKPAEAAEGPVLFSGALGSAVPVGTRLQRSDGIRYETTAAVILSSGTTTAPVTALEPGETANAAPGVALTLVSPVPGVQTGTVVGAPGLLGGVDVESDDDLRERILLRIRTPPMGGREGDYVRWALEVAGVTRAWVVGNHEGWGTVGIWFVTDDDPGGLIPSAEKVEEVQAHIDERRPVTARATVFAPVAVPLDFALHVTPDDAAVRAAVENSLADLLRREAVPGGTLLLSHIREAISTTPGEEDFQLTSPTADVVAGAAGELPVMGVVTWS